VTPEGTRYFLPPEARTRRDLVVMLSSTLELWGYEAVELPALEIYNPEHALADRAFKLVDKSGEVLALRCEFTTALAALVRHSTQAAGPLRLQATGPIWLREASAELGRFREYTQVDVELIGVSSPAADAELLELAHQLLQSMGFAEAKLEVGLPALVRDVLEATHLDKHQSEKIRESIQRKSTPELYQLLQAFGVPAELQTTLLQIPDLFGGREILQVARSLPLSQKAHADLDWLEAILALLPDVPLLLDLGRARHLGFYTGINFQAYTPDFGLPLLGGGRYDGSLLPKAAGFAVGIERVMEALALTPTATAADVLALDRKLAQELRQAGTRVEMAWTTNLEELRQYALSKGIRQLAVEGRLEDIH
jgi:ATP phosphoribosyltransferase regulatory subunit